MPLVRRIGAIVLVLAALVVWFAMAPDDGDRAADVESALSEYELNEALTEGAPQQQVVNGWVARDLLAVIARQETDERLPALAGLAVLGIALHLATTKASTSRGDTMAFAVPAPPQQDQPPTWAPSSPA